MRALLVVASAALICLVSFSVMSHAAQYRPNAPRIFPGFVCQTAPIRAVLSLDNREVFYKKSLVLL
jgi:hypothetical protein